MSGDSDNDALLDDVRALGDEIENNRYFLEYRRVRELGEEKLRETGVFDAVAWKELDQKLLNVRNTRIRYRSGKESLGALNSAFQTLQTSWDEIGKDYRAAYDKSNEFVSRNKNDHHNHTRTKALQSLDSGDSCDDGRTPMCVSKPVEVNPICESTGDIWSRTTEDQTQHLAATTGHSPTDTRAPSIQNPASDRARVQFVSEQEHRQESRASARSVSTPPVDSTLAPLLPVLARVIDSLPPSECERFGTRFERYLSALNHPEKGKLAEYRNLEQQHNLNRFLPLIDVAGAPADLLELLGLEAVPVPNRLLRPIDLDEFEVENTSGDGFRFRVVRVILSGYRIAESGKILRKPKVEVRAE